MRKMNRYNKVIVLFAAILSFSIQMKAQDVIINPDISYAGTPRSCEIGGIAVTGVEGYEDFVLTSLSGLEVGQLITVPGNEITNAIKRYWRHGLFSRVAITADSIVGSKIYLCIHLAMRPRVSVINYNEESLREVFEDVAKFAESEGLTCHAASIRARFER